jgi:hypothetical protein
MTYLDINAIVARHFGTTPNEIMYSQKYVGSYPRCAAMLICQQVLKASTLKLSAWYNKHQHTTPMRAIRTAHNRIEIDKDFRSMYKRSLIEVQMIYNAELEKKNTKQIYNLNHRVREKGIVVRTRSRTLSCSEAQLNSLNDSQLKKLLDTHHYAIQLSLI